MKCYYSLHCEGDPMSTHAEIEEKIAELKSDMDQFTFLLNDLSEKVKHLLLELGQPISYQETDEDIFVETLTQK